MTHIGPFWFVTDALVADVLNALEVASAHLVATSLGGLYALRGAAAHPESVDRMVQFGFTPGAGLTLVPVSMRIATLPGLRRVMQSIPPRNAVVRSIMRQLGHGPALADGRITPEMLDWFLALLRHTSTMRNDWNAPKALLQLGTKGQTLLPAEVLARVGCPVRYIWGGSDPMGGPRRRRALRRPDGPGTTRDVARVRTRALARRRTDGGRACHRLPAALTGT